METKYYVVYQINGPAYGYGMSENDAWEEAEFWIWIDPHCERDNLTCAECTKELHDAIAERGGDIHFDLNDDKLLDLGPLA